jgi:hypothetical protein
MLEIHFRALCVTQSLIPKTSHILTLVLLSLTLHPSRARHSIHDVVKLLILILIFFLPQHSTQIFILPAHFI